jgi:hypothetical protein
VTISDDVWCADLLHFSDVTYALRVRSGQPLPVGGFSKEELSDGALECVAEAVRVAGAPLNRRAWYQCVVSDYVLDTLLKDLPEREQGMRNERALGVGERGT